jgi:hypothetical protein
MELNHFYQLSFEYGQDWFSISRSGDVLFKVQRCPNFSLVLVDEERCEAEHFALLGLGVSRFEWLFFVNFDGVQTNLREVDPGLESVRAAFDWLLPPGYLSRQGDIGVYRATAPEKCDIEISGARAEQLLRSVLKDRHKLDGGHPRRYFARPGSVLIESATAMTIRHPEHATLGLGPGVYRLCSANGLVYPICQNARSFRGAPLFC